MRHFIGLLIIIFSLTGTAWAQSESDLKQFFEGKTVTLRIDLPATKEGVNIYPEREGLRTREVLRLLGQPRRCQSGTKAAMW